MAGDLTDSAYIARCFEFNASRFRSKFDDIYRKYSREFPNDDVIELRQHRIVRDNGVVKSMKPKRVGCATFGKRDRSKANTPQYPSPVEPGHIDSPESEKSFISANCSRWVADIGEESEPSDAETLTSDSEHDDDDDDDDSWEEVEEEGDGQWTSEERESRADWYLSEQGPEEEGRWLTLGEVEHHRRHNQRYPADRKTTPKSSGSYHYSRQTGTDGSSHYGRQMGTDYSRQTGTDGSNHYSRQKGTDGSSHYSRQTGTDDSNHYSRQMGTDYSRQTGTDDSNHYSRQMGTDYSRQTGTDDSNHYSRQTGTDGSNHYSRQTGTDGSNHYSRQTGTDDSNHYSRQMGTDYSRQTGTDDSNHYSRQTGTDGSNHYSRQTGTDGSNHYSRQTGTDDSSHYSRQMGTDGSSHYSRQKGTDGSSHYSRQTGTDDSNHYSRQMGTDYSRQTGTDDSIHYSRQMGTDYSRQTGTDDSNHHSRQTGTDDSSHYNRQIRTDGFSQHSIKTHTDGFAEKYDLESSAHIRHSTAYSYVRSPPYRNNRDSLLNRTASCSGGNVLGRIGPPRRIRPTQLFSRVEIGKDTFDNFSDERRRVVTFDDRDEEESTMFVISPDAADAGDCLGVRSETSHSPPRVWPPKRSAVSSGCDDGDFHLPGATKTADIVSESSPEILPDIVLESHPEILPPQPSSLTARCDDVDFYLSSKTKTTDIVRVASSPEHSPTSRERDTTQGVTETEHLWNKKPVFHSSPFSEDKFEKTFTISRSSPQTKTMGSSGRTQIPDLRGVQTSGLGDVESQDVQSAAGRDKQEAEQKQQQQQSGLAQLGTVTHTDRWQPIMKTCTDTCSHSQINEHNMASTSSQGLGVSSRVAATAVMNKAHTSPSEGEENLLNTSGQCLGMSSHAVPTATIDKAHTSHPEGEENLLNTSGQCLGMSSHAVPTATIDKAHTSHPENKQTSVSTSGQCLGKSTRVAPTAVMDVPHTSHCDPNGPTHFVTFAAADTKLLGMPCKETSMAEVKGQSRTLSMFSPSLTAEQRAVTNGLDPRFQQTGEGAGGEADLGQVPTPLSDSTAMSPLDELKKKIEMLSSRMTPRMTSEPDAAQTSAPRHEDMDLSPLCQLRQKIDNLISVLTPTKPPVMTNACEGCKDRSACDVKVDCKSPRTDIHANKTYILTDKTDHKEHDEHAGSSGGVVPTVSNTFSHDSHMRHDERARSLCGVVPTVSNTSNQDSHKRHDEIAGSSCVVVPTVSSTSSQDSHISHDKRAGSWCGIVPTVSSTSSQATSQSVSVHRQQESKPRRKFVPLFKSSTKEIQEALETHSPEAFVDFLNERYIKSEPQAVKDESSTEEPFSSPQSNSEKFMGKLPRCAQEPQPASTNSLSSLQSCTPGGGRIFEPVSCKTSLYSPLYHKTDKDILSERPQAPSPKPDVQGTDSDDRVRVDVPGERLSTSSRAHSPRQELWTARCVHCDTKTHTTSPTVTALHQASNPHRTDTSPIVTAHHQASNPHRTDSWQRVQYLSSGVFQATPGQIFRQTIAPPVQTPSGTNKTDVDIKEDVDEKTSDIRYPLESYSKEFAESQNKEKLGVNGRLSVAPSSPIRTSGRLLEELESHPVYTALSSSSSGTEQPAFGSVVHQIFTQMKWSSTTPPKSQHRLTTRPTAGCMTGHSTRIGSDGQPHTVSSRTGSVGQPHTVSSRTGSVGQPHTVSSRIGSDGQPHTVSSRTGSVGQPHTVSSRTGSVGQPHTVSSRIGSDGQPHTVSSRTGSVGQPHTVSSRTGSVGQPHTVSSRTGSDGQPHTVSSRTGSDGQPHTVSSRTGSDGQPHTVSSRTGSDGQPHTVSRTGSDGQPHTVSSRTGSDGQPHTVSSRTGSDGQPHTVSSWTGSDGQLHKDPTSCILHGGVSRAELTCVCEKCVEGRHVVTKATVDGPLELLKDMDMNSVTSGTTRPGKITSDSRQNSDTLQRGPCWPAAGRADREYCDGPQRGETRGTSTYSVPGKPSQPDKDICGKTCAGAASPSCACRISSATGVRGALGGHKALDSPDGLGSQLTTGSTLTRPVGHRAQGTVDRSVGNSGLGSQLTTCSMLTGSVHHRAQETGDRSVGHSVSCGSLSVTPQSVRMDGDHSTTPSKLMNRLHLGDTHSPVSISKHCDTLSRLVLNSPGRKQGQSGEYIPSKHDRAHRDLDSPGQKYGESSKLALSKHDRAHRDLDRPGQKYGESSKLAVSKHDRAHRDLDRPGQKYGESSKLAVSKHDREHTLRGQLRVRQEGDSPMPAPDLPSSCDRPSWKIFKTRNSKPLPHVETSASPSSSTRVPSSPRSTADCVVFRSPRGRPTPQSVMSTSPRLLGSKMIRISSSPARRGSTPDMFSFNSESPVAVGSYKRSFEREADSMSCALYRESSSLCSPLKRRRVDTIHGTSTPSKLNRDSSAMKFDMDESLSTIAGDNIDENSTIHSTDSDSVDDPDSCSDDEDEVTLIPE